MHRELDKLNGVLRAYTLASLAGYTGLTIKHRKMVLDGDIAPWTNRLATSASDTFILDMEQMRFPFLGFRIGAP